MILMEIIRLFFVYENFLIKYIKNYHTLAELKG